MTGGNLSGNRIQKIIRYDLYDININYFQRFFVACNAENSAPALCSVSKYSFIGIESVTIPAPD